MIQSEVFRNIILPTIQSAPSSTRIMKHELVVETKDIEKMVDVAVTIIRGEPLTKLVNKAVEQVISSNHFQLSLSRPIDKIVEKLTEIAVVM